MYGSVVVVSEYLVGELREPDEMAASISACAFARVEGFLMRW